MAGGGGSQLEDREGERRRRRRGGGLDVKLELDEHRLAAMPQGMRPEPLRDAG